jgi:hypothetical protein
MGERNTHSPGLNPTCSIKARADAPEFKPHAKHELACNWTEMKCETLEVVQHTPQHFPQMCARHILDHHIESLSGFCPQIVDCLLVSDWLFENGL